MKLFGNSLGLLGKKRAPLAASTMGTNPAFGQPSNGLPQNFGFNDLAGYEQGQYKDYAANLRNTLASRRADLSKSLTDQGKALFDAANPGILEDLNSRGVLSSPTAVATAQGNALRDIGMDNQKYLNDFDTQATGLGLQADQEALDSNLNLRQSELQQRLADSNSEADRALAENLARKQGRNSLTGALIGLGGSLGGGVLAGGARGLFGGGGVTGGTGSIVGGAGHAASSLFPGGLGQVSSFGATPGAASSSLFPGGVSAAPAGIGLGGAAAIGGAGLGAMALANQGKKIAGIPGALLANPIGAQLNAVKGVGKKISKAFCFDANTPVTMANGSEKMIKDLNLGEQTKGGAVLSFRASICEDGDLFRYFGTTVTGSHAVFENGCWIRVADSPYSTPIAGESIVYSIVTDLHRVWINGNLFADEFETDDYEDLNPDESLAEMNRRDGFVRVN
jgi:hypothetical protein